jgi:hypothetical protein
MHLGVVLDLAACIGAGLLDFRGVRARNAQDRAQACSTQSVRDDRT